jgi:hypothetical protein
MTSSDDNGKANKDRHADMMKAVDEAQARTASAVASLMESLEELKKLLKDHTGLK